MSDNPPGKLLRSAEGGGYGRQSRRSWPACAAWATASHAGAATCSSGARPKRTELARNVRLVLGNELSPAAQQQAVRDWSRLASCSRVM